MRVLYLGPKRGTLLEIFAAHWDRVRQTEELLTDALVDGTDAVVSYGYRYIIREPFLSFWPQAKRINLHIAYLPWNRGADPNLWSALEDTPMGVTIHQLDAGLDTGPIIAQERLERHHGDTLKTTYERLDATIVELFALHWPVIREGRYVTQPAIGKGSAHRSRDKAPFLPLLTEGWDTPIAGLLRKGLQPQPEPRVRPGAS